jgi:hypothetical protein
MVDVLAAPCFDASITLVNQRLASTADALGRVPNQPARLQV